MSPVVPVALLLNIQNKFMCISLNANDANDANDHYIILFQTPTEQQQQSQRWSSNGFSNINLLQANAYYCVSATRWSKQTG